MPTHVRAAKGQRTWVLLCLVQFENVLHVQHRPLAVHPPISVPGHAQMRKLQGRTLTSCPKPPSRAPAQARPLRQPRALSALPSHTARWSAETQVEADLRPPRTFCPPNSLRGVKR
eukprot:483781-Rhodomonas_salina.1